MRKAGNSLLVLKRFGRKYQP